MRFPAPITRSRLSGRANRNQSGGRLILEFPREVGSSHEGIAHCTRSALGILIVLQLVMGLLIRNGQASLRTAHFHSGSLMVLVALAYIALSLSAILSRPRPERF